jgi:Ca2+-binding RTX toxin-like protein
MKGVIRKSLAVAAGLLFLVPASALAGTASVEDGIARYDAKFGETNRVTVGELPGPVGGKLVVFRDVVPIDVEGNCSNPIGVPNEARCLVEDGVTRARAGLGNRDDRIEANATIPPRTFGLSVEGDLGDDTLLGTAQRDVLDGNGGNDVIRGRNGNDHVEGGNGQDDVKGENGNDVVEGNDGDPGDALDCGADDDLAIFNQGDTVSSNCEQIQLQ